MAKKAKTTQIDRVALIDELGALDLELDALKKKKDRADAIRGLLRFEASKFPTSAGVIWDGIKFAVQLGAQGNERTIPDRAKLIAAIGQQTFNAIASVPLGKLDEVCPNAEALGLLVKERTGQRSVNTYLRGEGA